MSKKKKAVAVDLWLNKWEWDRNKLKEVDKSLYCVLQALYELKLISGVAFHAATTTETKLLNFIEEP